MKRSLLTAAIAATTLLAPLAGHAQTTTKSYTGNGAAGFGGPVGNGTFTISSQNGNLTFSLAPGASLNDDAVVYIDSVAGGFTSTSSFSDNGDGGRTAVSGANVANGTRSIATFAPGFAADYALSIENSYFSLFQLASGGNNSFTYITGAGQSAAPYTLSFPTSDIGLTSGQGFNFVASLISTTAYRSNETIGNSVTTVDPSNPGAAPNAGAGGTTTFSNFDTFTPAPEPSGIASLLIGAAVLGGAVIVRRRRTTNLG